MTPAVALLPAVGVDIGGTKVAGGLVAADGTVLDTARRATPGASVIDTEEAIVAVVTELVGPGGRARGRRGRRGGRLVRPHR